MHLLLFTWVLLAFDWCAAKGAILGIEVWAVNMIAVVLDSNIQVILARVMVKVKLQLRGSLCVKWEKFFAGM